VTFLRAILKVPYKKEKIETFSKMPSKRSLFNEKRHFDKK
jgi:hypothetical protein